MVNRSNFPNSVDTFNTMVDILSSDKTNVQRYQTLLMQETRTPAEETELTNLKNTLVNKIISSEHLNFISDAITNMQDYYLNEVVAHLATLDVGVLRTDLDNHSASRANPHQVTKTQIGLSNVDNVKQASKSEFDSHIANTSNPHGVTAAQVGAYTKTESDNKFVVGVGQRIEVHTALFFTNGGSSQSTANVNFNSAFTVPPVIVPANIGQAVSYGDTLMHPFIYSVTTTGFSVKIETVGGALLGSATPTNMAMNFLVIGK